MTDTSFVPFEKELAIIVNPAIKELAVEILATVPDYFYSIPASSTGKYHPTYALGEGGLYRHVRAAIVIANHIMRLEQCEFFPEEKDMIIVSLMFHDCWKQGEDRSGQTVHEHPQIAALKVLGVSNKYPRDDTKWQAGRLIAMNIVSHMGQWNISDYSPVILKKPRTDVQKFVHMCDYLASRKDIEVLIDRD